MTTENPSLADVPETAAPGPSWLEQDPTLRQMWQDGVPPDDIATTLNRSVAAIMTRAARLGLPRRAAPGRKRGYKRTDAPRRERRTVRVKLAAARGEAAESDFAPARDETKMRVCLMCLNKFQSQGRHNRICPACKGSAEYMTGSSTPDYAFRGND